MTKKDLTQTILQYAVDKARTGAPAPLDFNTTNPYGNINLEFMDAFQSLESHLVNKAGIVPGNELSEDVKNASRAAMFATSVMSSLYMDVVLRENIDNFIGNPDNQHLFAEYNDVQKQALAQELKDTVSGKLQIIPETPEGETLVSNITQKFNEAGNADGCCRLLGRGIAAANRMLDELNNSNNVAAAVQRARTKIQNADTLFTDVMGIQPDRSFDHMLLDSFLNDAKALSTENRELMSQVVGGIPVSIDTKQDAQKVRSFLSRFHNGRRDNWLTPEMSEWVDEKMAQFNVDMVNSAMVDGSPLFDDDRIDRLSETEKKAEVLAHALKGKNVKCRDSNDNEVVFLPQIADNRPKSFWDRIIGFFERLFGLDGISRMREGIEETHEKNVQVREKMSLEEISGMKGLNKVAPPSKKKDAPSAEMNRR